jgi:sugar lactone lactonase YvrE
MRYMSISLLALLSWRAIGAQATAVDSATAARGAWQRAQAALKTGTLKAAREHIAFAASVWPTQPAYLWARATLAAEAADTADVERALRAYADLGLGRRFDGDSLMARLVALPRFTKLADAHLRNRSPISRSEVLLHMKDSTIWPEGVDVDPRTGRFFITSVRHRTIVAVSPAGEERDLWPRDRSDVGAVLAVRFDTGRAVLWATTSGIPQMAGYRRADSSIAALLRVRPSDGTVERRWDLPVVPGGHVLGDVALGSNGDVYFTDSKAAALYVLRAGSTTLDRITDPLLRSPQGIAVVPGGRFVYVADYSHGLIRVDLATRTALRVADPPNVTALGCDGIVWDRGAIVAIQNGVDPARVVRFTLDAAGLRIVRAEVLDRHSDIADEPTVGTLVGHDFVYIANSQWNRYTDDGVRKAGGVLTAPILLRLRLPE